MEEHLLMKIKHLSINATNPKRSAQILAELTLGEIKPFPSANMDNAWQCIWDEAENELVEFIPSNFSLKYGEHAAIYEKQKDDQNFNANHIMLGNLRISPPASACG